MVLDDRKKIGLGLTGFGVFFLFIGTLLLFDKGLLALGNLLFLSGIVVTIGVPSTVKFFTQKRNRRGSIAFLGGASLVVMGRTIIGLLIESVGFWLLFAAFIPTALAFLRKVPYLNKVLDLPLLKNIINKIAPMQGLPV